MKRWSAMLIAGEASGDRLAADLVHSLRQGAARTWSAPVPDLQPRRTSLDPEFFGAGGPQMAQAGVALSLDLTRHSVIGLVEVIRKLHKFKRIYTQLLQEAITRQPDALIGVDFSGLNRRLAQAVKRHVRSRCGPFRNWNPKLVQYVSPQVWASRPGRAKAMERDYDLVLSIFPFEKEWYARHAPGLRVEYVGHPLVDQYYHAASNWTPAQANTTGAAQSPLVLLLPGSRPGEIERHAGPILGCARIMSARPDLRFRVVLPSQELAVQLEELWLPDYKFLREERACLELQIGDLAGALLRANVAIACTGTVTMECAYFGVPTVAFYKTSWGTFQIAKRIVHVNHVAMPNILAGETLYPEFLQNQATAHSLARAALALLDNPDRRLHIRTELGKLAHSLGPPGASQRAASAILSLS
jgi:lipid-A-disaccharide synthase